MTEEKPIIRIRLPEKGASSITPWLQAATEGSTPKDQATLTELSVYLKQLGVKQIVYAGSSTDLMPFILSQAGNTIHLVDFTFLRGSRFYKPNELDDMMTNLKAINIDARTSEITFQDGKAVIRYQDKSNAAPILLLHPDSRDAYFSVDNPVIYTTEVSPPPAPEFYLNMPKGGRVVIAHHSKHSNVLQKVVYSEPRLTYSDLGFTVDRQFKVDKGLPKLSKLSNTSGKLVNQGMSSYNKNRQLTVLIKSQEPTPTVKEQLICAGSLAEVKLSMEFVLAFSLNVNKGELQVALRLFVESVERFLERAKKLQDREQRLANYEALRECFSAAEKNELAEGFTISNSGPQRDKFEELWYACWVASENKIHEMHTNPTVR